MPQQNMDDLVSTMDAVWSDPDNTMDYLDGKPGRKIQPKDKKVRERLTPVRVTTMNNKAKLNLD